MPDIKHVGRMKKSRAKVAVAYRTLPGDSSSALVIETTKLDAPDHDALISVSKAIVDKRLLNCTKHFKEAIHQTVRICWLNFTRVDLLEKLQLLKLK